MSEPVEAPLEPAPAPATPLEITWERPHPLTPLVHFWIWFVAIVVFNLRDFTEKGFKVDEDFPWNRLLVLGVFFGVVALVGGIVGYFQWRFTRLGLDAEALTLDYRFIQHTNERIPFTKIQSVDIVQPFAARLLGLAALRVDVGGKAQKIQFLRRARAESLRDELITRAARAGAPIRPELVQPAEQAIPAALPGVPEGMPPPQQAPAAMRFERLVTATPRNLVIAAVTSTEFIMSVLALLVMGVVPIIIWGRVVSLAAVIPGVIGIFSLISGRVIKEWDYSLSRSDQGVHISRGLTTKVSQTLPTDRIQGFSISQGILTRRFGLWRVQINVLGYDGEEADEGASNVLLPAGTWDDVLVALGAVWPGFRLDQIEQHPIPERAKWLVWYGLKSHRFGFDDRVMVSQRGIINRNIAIVSHARVQSVHLSQGPVERKLDLASVGLHLTDGPVNLVVGHVDSAAARDLAFSELDRARLGRRSERDAKRLIPVFSSELAGASHDDLDEVRPQSEATP